MKTFLSLKAIFIVESTLSWSKLAPNLDFFCIEIKLKICEER